MNDQKQEQSDAVHGTAAPKAAVPTRLDVLSLIRQHCHRVYSATVNAEHIDTKYMREIEDAIGALAAAPAAPDALLLIAEARAVFDVMLDGFKERKFGDYQNGEGTTIGPLMDALHAKLKAFPASAVQAEGAQALKCATCGGTGRVCIGRSGREDDGNGPVMEDCGECNGNPGTAPTAAADGGMPKPPPLWNVHSVERQGDFGVRIVWKTGASASEYERFMRAALSADRATLAALAATPSKPIYQAQMPGEQGSAKWHDVSEDAYHTFMPDHRRIVSATPSEAAPAGQSEECEHVLDRFAAKALLGVVTAIMQFEGHNWKPSDFAREAYEIADAMLAERAKRLAPAAAQPSKDE